MAKVTSKLQVTIPKAIADQYGISPGDEIEFEPAGPTIRVRVPGRSLSPPLGLEERQRVLEQMFARVDEAQKGLRLVGDPPKERDWKREDLYVRGQSD